MLQVQVAPPLSSSRDLGLRLSGSLSSCVSTSLGVGLQLKGGVRLRRSSRCRLSCFRLHQRQLLIGIAIVLYNLAELELLLALLNFFCSLNIIMLTLNAIEACGTEILHRLLAGPAVGEVFLHVADHRLVAHGVEGLLGASAQVRQLRDVAGERVLSQGFLDVVAEVGDEALAVVQLDEESLGVDWRPFTANHLFGFAGLSLFGDLVRAFHCLDLEIVLEVDAPDLVTSELELEIIIDKLKAVWHFVRAHLLSSENIHSLRLGRHVEVPNTVQALSEAMYRLVCSDRLEQCQNS